MARQLYNCSCGKSHHSWLARLTHLFFRRKRVEREHWVPNPRSEQSVYAGPGRCFWCLRHQLSREFRKPCPGGRPSQVELA